MTKDKLQSFANAEFAQLARTLGNAHRLALLDHLAQGERNVERLAEVAGLSVANASQHLLHLKRSGFVESRREGKNVIYQLGDGPVIPLLIALRDFAQFNRQNIQALLNDTRGDADGMEPVSRQELRQMLQTNSVTLLDVRPREEFDLGHIPGAINIHLEDLEHRLSHLPKDAAIVAYCRGPYCLLSVEAVSLLRKQGRFVRHLEDGYPEWKAAGMAVTAEGAA